MSDTLSPILYQAHKFAVQNIETWQADSSTGNSLFSSPHPLDFNMLVILSLKNVKQGHKLELTFLYACWFMHQMEWQRWPKKLLIWGGLGPSMLPW